MGDGITNAGTYTFFNSCFNYDGKYCNYKICNKPPQKCGLNTRRRNTRNQNNRRVITLMDEAVAMVVVKATGEDLDSMWVTEKDPPLMNLNLPLKMSSRIIRDNGRFMVLDIIGITSINGGNS